MNVETEQAPPFVQGNPYAGEDKAAVQAKKLESAKAFTRVYRANLDKPIPIREALCLAEQYPALCREIQDYDLFAGRLYHHPLIGFGLEFGANAGIRALKEDTTPYRDVSEATNELRIRLGRSNCGFSYDYAHLVGLRDDPDTTAADRKAIQGLIDFWWEHSPRYLYNKRMTEEMVEHLGRYSQVGSPRYVSTFFRLCCVSLDYDTLLRLGIPGMIARIKAKRDAAGCTRKQKELYEGMLLALGVLVNVCEHYQEQAAQKALNADTPERAAELREMAAVLAAIVARKPRNLREAIQLFWIYNRLTDTCNWGRMDIYLGDFYAHDIDTGVLTEEQAERLIGSLWRIISEMRYYGGGTRPNSRIIVGGRGRRNEANANRFAMAALRVTKRLKVTEPNLTLRFYEGQDPALLDKALEVIGAGCIHPGLYNDDWHIPMVADAYDVPREDAEQYVPEGCGELMIDHKSVGSPNNILTYTTALDLVLHNGVDTQIDTRMGLPLGDAGTFDTFEKLLEAFKKQIDHTNDLLAKRHALEHEVERETGAFLFMSMLTDDCIDRGKALYDHGARYLGGIIETFALTNVSDSLVAIRELVYEKRAFTLEQLVAMLDANFEGYERERHMLLDAPKFGNDDPVADQFHTELSRFVCESAKAAAKRNGLHFFLNCNLNVGGLHYSGSSKASADGRRYGEPFALGNAPTAGRDKSGITAVLNSLSKHRQPCAGYVQNIKLSQSLFQSENRAKTRHLLDTYFQNGGCQLMVTALSQQDLEAAMREPEKYPRLLVRVAGWTSKFVELPRRYQQEIVNRTHYA